MAEQKLSKREELKKDVDRSMEVYKRDDLIQKARFTLSLQEQKCVLYAISKIKPSDTIFQEYIFELKEFYSLCGIKSKSYTELKAILKRLSDKSWWAEIDDKGSESLLRWFNSLKTNKGSGTVKIKFHEDMMPFLLQLAKQDAFYTRYELRYILPMNCQYSPRLYELLKSYQKNNHEWFFEIDKLKKLLDCENYSRFPDFRRFALEPAVEEINKYTDIKIAWEPEKEGRRIAKIYFYMLDKKKEDLIEAQRAGLEQLDGQINYSELLESIQNSVKSQFFRENRESD